MSAARWRWRAALLASLFLAVACTSDGDGDGPSAESDAAAGDAAPDTDDANGDVRSDDADATGDNGDTSDDADATGDDADTSDDDADASGDDATPAPDGEALYDRYCGFCHGDDGEGYLADNANALAHPGFLATASDAFLRDSTIYGRPGTPMSPWGASQGGPLDDDEVDAIVAFIRAWQTEPSVSVDDVVVDGSADRGGAVFNALCVDCHGAEGEGITAVSLNNPWFHELASDGFIRYAIENGREPLMPPYGDVLTAQELDDVVAYIRTWQTPVDGTPIEPFEPDLSQALLNPDGPDADFTLREGRFAAAADVKQALDEQRRIVLLDARPTADYLENHLAGATSLPFYDLDEAAIAELPTDAWIITYCGCPHAVSGQLADALLEAGFERVAVLDEGYYHWVDQGWPLQAGRERGTP